VAPVPGLEDLRLYSAHPASRLGELVGGDASPYWAFSWAGGLALARYLTANPQTVAGRRVVDLGSGSGLVAIAAARAGAASVVAVDIDRHAVAAVALNAALNGVTVMTLLTDATGGPPPDADVVLAGDVFYSPEVAQTTGPFLQRCADAGLAVLIGDPGRAFLPSTGLAIVAKDEVGDFAGGSATMPAFVYQMEPTTA